MDYIGSISAGLGAISEESKKLREVAEGMMKFSRSWSADLNKTADCLDSAVNDVLGSIAGFTEEAMRVKEEIQSYGHGTTVAKL